MAALKLLAAIPILLLTIILELLFPILIRRKCHTCDGKGFIPEQGPALIICDTCKDYERWEHCEDCGDTGLIELPGTYYRQCPECNHGTIPRIWAWNMNLIQYEGHYRSAFMNDIFTYQGD